MSLAALVARAAYTNGGAKLEIPRVRSGHSPRLRVVLAALPMPPMWATPGHDKLGQSSEKESAPTTFMNRKFKPQEFTRLLT
ncbi:uncharacterized protein RCC_03947 [Ramularia collo-cygni]|uniref:Uncharacterized protein n=1 Tax=Ramularia collo-cygni TaxID=112498 RepID=A0A2D3V0B0_9PEZI|nr:uncharacterized protein RCC_03947 [Ramularia collo-cygni]CZT18107.1 uncharacterized protein RCC_03947 [Ramularia collo-cygni]